MMKGLKGVLSRSKSSSTPSQVNPPAATTSSDSKQRSTGVHSPAQRQITEQPSNKPTLPAISITNTPTPDPVR
ncbi:hypothetical protein K450DRAFT_255152 [Umbelopsis ramanniana AG]|uniref:Uncharacterized protein n=1 Tax=Umbelopsis ramanniana AG TaxID=1314678 RepID=A0AAD5E5Q4_UMBRA|nr:uncharacterized protein K450DRAFT_255152 [Umbelopsis ramanniana AG]KAI8576821.1 hypothetical protein K450DRAFT_255152 [Umbelopsis ramanniana AG]